MGSQRHKGIFVWFKGLFSPKVAPLSEIARAKSLISAVDRGGIPLNAAKVNAIARDLGLEVSRTAPVEETIQRIRNALGRINHHD